MTTATRYSYVGPAELRDRGTSHLVTDCIRYQPADLTALDVVPAPVVASGTLTVFESGTGWVAELPRLALVGIGTKDRA